MHRRILVVVGAMAFTLLYGAHGHVAGAQEAAPAVDMLEALPEPAGGVLEAPPEPSGGIVETSGDPVIGDPISVDSDGGMSEANAEGSPLRGSGLDYSGCGGASAPTINGAYEQEVVERTNAERLSNGGLPPLKRVTTLDAAGRYHGTDMAADNYFNHNTYDRVGGNLVLNCGWVPRVSSYYSGYAALAENIAAGQQTPQSVMTSWMNSAGHRANILSSSVWEIGVGYYCCGGTYSRYWVQDFGRNSGVYPLIINREAATTESAAVNVYVYGSFAQMRLRNDAGAWGAWQTFSNTVNWTLPATGGVHTVTAEMKSGTTVYSSSDTINLLQGGGSSPTVAPPGPTATAPAPAPTQGTQNSIIAAHDAYVYSALPNNRYGLSGSLAIRGSTAARYRTFAKFTVSGQSGPPAFAKMRLYAYDGGTSGGAVYSASNNYAGSATAWVESGINWNNSPAITGTPLATVGSVPTGSWVEYPVTAAITGNGTFSFGITSAAADLVAFYSRQMATNRPVLVITP